MKKIKDPSKNKHDLPILKSSAPAAGNPVPETTSEKPEEHMFASVADKEAFFAEFGKQPFYRALVRATVKLPVTFEEARPVAEKGRVHLRALAGRFDDGKEGNCANGAACRNPKYTFVPKASFVIDWSDPVNPKRKTLKVKGDNDERVTLLTVKDDHGVKSYHLYADGRITTRGEDGKTIILPDNEAEIVKEAAEPVYLFDGNYYADEEKLEVIGPVCYLDIRRAEELAEKAGALKPRFTSKAAAEDMVARATAKRERAAARQAHFAERDAARNEVLTSRFVKPGRFTDGRPGSRKTERSGRNSRWQ